MVLGKEVGKMKVCGLCGSEAVGGEGQNVCRECEALEEAGKKAAAVRAKRRAQRKARDQVMRSLGLVKVRGNLGGTYWE